MVAPRHQGDHHQSVPPRPATRASPPDAPPNGSFRPPVSGDPAGNSNKDRNSFFRISEPPRAPESVNEFKMDGLKPFFPDAGELARDVSVAVADDLRHVRTVTARTVKEQLQVANAARHLGCLPKAGESLHLVCKGNFAAWDFVPAVLRIAAPATIRRLDIVTLGFSKKNVQELAGLMDARTVRETWFLFSCYFRSSSKSESEFLFEQMRTRAAKVAAVRSHAKLLLLELTDGRHVVIETSANLRSCRNIEQFTICDDRELLLFHRGWISSVANEANRARP